MTRRGRPGEFELIARYFAPLAKGFRGARGLKSDNAFLAPDPRYDLVVKTDTVVAGVHFLADEKPQIVAAKALRVCLLRYPDEYHRHLSPQRPSQPNGSEKGAKPG